MRWLDRITDLDMNLSKLQEISGGQRSLYMLQSMRLQRVGHDLATEQRQQVI